MSTTNAQQHQAMMAALGGIQNGMEVLARDVGDVKQAQAAIVAKVDKMADNINGDGSIGDPGIAGEVRGLLAWERADKPKIAAMDKTVAELVQWRTAQTAMWRQVFAWINVPMGLIALATWVATIVNGHQSPRPAPPPQQIKVNRPDPIPSPPAPRPASSGQVAGK
ncbi:hypothetical protein D3C72_852570 [compost metagenome]